MWVVAGQTVLGPEVFFGHGQMTATAAWNRVFPPRRMFLVAIQTGNGGLMFLTPGLDLLNLFHMTLGAIGNL